MDYKKEYGRYKKKVEEQEKKISDLREEMDGFEQLVGASNAILTAILYAVGANEGAPVKVDRAVIGAAMKGQYVARVEIQKDAQDIYLLHYAENGGDGNHGEREERGGACEQG